MIATMRSVQMTAVGGPDVLKPALVPRPLAGDEEVLVKLSHSGVAYNDFMIRTDFYRHPGAGGPELPLILGEEGSGIVESVGKNVFGFSVGDRVGFLAHKTQTYAEYSSVPASHLFKLPDDIADEISIGLTHSGLAARALLHEYVPVGEDSVVLVTGGSGSVGSVIVEWASKLGATVVATVTSDASGDWVRQLGATHVVNINKENIGSIVEKATGGKGVDLALDSVGGEGFPDVFESLGTRGVVVPFGVASGKYPRVDPLDLVDRSRAIAETFPLEEAAQAHRALEQKGRRGKILLKI